MNQLHAVRSESPPQGLRQGSTFLPSTLALSVITARLLLEGAQGHSWMCFVTLWLADMPYTTQGSESCVRIFISLSACIRVYVSYVDYVLNGLVPVTSGL